MSNAFVVAMGLGTVFFGLICIVFIILLMGKIIGFIESKHQPAQSTDSVADDSELIAVITAALAQDLGTDANNIVIRSIKSVD